MMIQKNTILKHKYVTLKRVSKSQFDEHHNWCTFSCSYLALRTFWSLFRRKKHLPRQVLFSMKRADAHEASCAATREAGLRPMKRAFGTRKGYRALRFMAASRRRQLPPGGSLYDLFAKRLKCLQSCGIIKIGEAVFFWHDIKQLSREIKNTSLQKREIVFAKRLTAFMFFCYC